MCISVSACLQVFADHFIVETRFTDPVLAFMDSALGTCWMDYGRNAAIVINGVWRLSLLLELHGPTARRLRLSLLAQSCKSLTMPIRNGYRMIIENRWYFSIKYPYIKLTKNQTTIRLFIEFALIDESLSDFSLLCLIYDLKYPNNRMVVNR